MRGCTGFPSEPEAALADKRESLCSILTLELHPRVRPKVIGQLYFQTYSLNARLPGILRFQSNVRISVDCFRFQIRTKKVRL